MRDSALGSIGRTGVALSASLLLVLASAPPASASIPPGTTERASVTSAGDQANGAARLPAISADGTTIAFESDATNLVPGDANDTWDVFVRSGGTTERVSVASDGTEGNARSRGAAISGDGRLVVFTSEASNLVPGDTNGAEDVFLHDRETGTTERVSVAPGDEQADDASFGGAISADGRVVAFGSAATNLVPGDANGVEDVFVRDLATGAVEIVSVATDGTPGDEGSGSPSLSADGQRVAFDSSATTLAADDTDGSADVFVRDRGEGTTVLASAPTDGTDAPDDPSLPGQAWARLPAISGDGTTVAFTSHQRNLVPGDTDGAADAFVRDLAAGTTERVSVTSDGEADGPGWSPAISHDGRIVAFQRGFDVVVHDRGSGTVEVVSAASNGAGGSSLSDDPAISADGRIVAFGSLSSNLVAGDTNASEDVFLRDRGPRVGVGGLDVFDRGTSVAVTGWARFSGRALSSATDPEGDALPGAAAAGADLTGVTVTHRPERGDVQVRMAVPDLPRSRTVCFGGCAVTDPGAPAVVYGLEFVADIFRYEVRGVRPATAGPGERPTFAMYYCPSACFEVEGVSARGGIGETGEEIVLTFPLAGIGFAGFATLTDVRAFTAAAPADPGAGPNIAQSPAVLDEVALPDAVVREGTVEVAIAPAGVPLEEVAFGDPVALQEGRFEGSVSTGGLSPGAYEVWARACVQDACGLRSTPFTVG